MMADGVNLPPSSSDAAAVVPAAKEIPIGKAEIVSIPPELEELPVAQKISGEVTSVNKDGSITVRTDKGNITLIPKTPIAAGTKVTVQLPPTSESGTSVQLSLPPVQSRPPSVVLPHTQIPAEIVDTVSGALEQGAKDFGKTFIPPRFGQPVKSVIYPTPIIMVEDIADLPEVLPPGEKQAVKPGALPQTNNSQNLSLIEMLQQTEESAGGAMPQVTDKLSQILRNTIIKENDALIRNLLGLPAKPQYIPPSPLTLQYQQLPLTGKTIFYQPQQTSNLAFPVLPDANGQKPQGPVIPSLSEAVAEFQKAGIKSPQFMQVFENTAAQTVTAKIIQIQNPQVGAEKAVAPFRIFIPEVMQQSGIPGLVQPVSDKGNIGNMISQTPVDMPANNIKPTIIQAVSTGTVLLPKPAAQGEVQTQTVKATIWATSSGFAVIPNDGDDIIQPGKVALISIENNINVSSAKTVVQLPNILLQQSGITGITNAFSVPDMILGEEWPALQQTAAALMEISAASARTFLSNIPMPTVPPQFTPAVLFFMAALRIGDIKAWTGEKVIETLERAGKSELAKRLGGDFASASARSKEPLADGWRPFPIPLLYDENISRMQLFVRRDEDDENDGKKGGKAAGKTRFLIDLVLSRIGEIQIDGLIRGKQMDMIVRTKHNLPHEMQQNIRRRFMHASEMTGMNGSIHMYGRGEGWVKVERPVGAPGVRV